MTPANVIKLEKAAREFVALAKRKNVSAQDATLGILRTLEMVHLVLVDLAFRPEVNSPNAGER